MFAMIDADQWQQINQYNPLVIALLSGWYQESKNSLEIQLMAIFTLV